MRIFQVIQKSLYFHFQPKIYNGSRAIGGGSFIIGRIVCLVAPLPTGGRGGVGIWFPTLPLIPVADDVTRGTKGRAEL